MSGPTTKKCVQLYTVLLTLTLSFAALGADWSSCQDDLDRLRRRASDASDAASRVRSNADELEQKKRDWEDCRAYPQVYDVYRDRCSSQRYEYETARSDYESARSTFESSASDVESVIRSAESSCDYQFAASSVGSVDPACRNIQRYKGRLPTQALIDICKRSRTDEQCKKCLE
jgi:hypothetical protein